MMQFKDVIDPVVEPYGKYSPLTVQEFIDALPHIYSILKHAGDLPSHLDQVKLRDLASIALSDVREYINAVHFSIAFPAAGMSYRVSAEMVKYELERAQSQFAYLQSYVPNPAECLLLLLRAHHHYMITNNKEAQPIIHITLINRHAL